MKPLVGTRYCQANGMDMTIRPPELLVPNIRIVIKLNMSHPGF
jgi:hypothetical protein